MISSVMYYVTFNPYWNAPDHLVRTAIAPKTIAGGAKYFKSMGYQVMADWTRESATIPFETIDWKAVAAGKTRLRVRQDPGARQALRRPQGFTPRGAVARRQRLPRPQSLPDARRALLAPGRTGVRLPMSQATWPTR